MTRIVMIIPVAVVTLLVSSHMLHFVMAIDDVYVNVANIPPGNINVSYTKNEAPVLVNSKDTGGSIVKDSIPFELPGSSPKETSAIVTENKSDITQKLPDSQANRDNSSRLALGNNECICSASDIDVLDEILLKLVKKQIDDALTMINEATKCVMERFLEVEKLLDAFFGRHPEKTLSDNSQNTDEKCRQRRTMPLILPPILGQTLKDFENLEELFPQKNCLSIELLLYANEILQVYMKKLRPVKKEEKELHESIQSTWDTFFMPHTFLHAESINFVDVALELSFLLDSLEESLGRNPCFLRPPTDPSDGSYVLPSAVKELVEQISDCASSILECISDLRLISGDLGKLLKAYYDLRDNNPLNEPEANAKIRAHRTLMLAGAFETRFCELNEQRRENEKAEETETKQNANTQDNTDSDTLRELVQRLEEWGRRKKFSVKT